MKKNRNLTEREKQIIYAVSRGLTNKKIAKSLNITERTVEFHLCNVFQKLKVVSRSSAVFQAVKLGILDLHDLPVEIHR